MLFGSLWMVPLALVPLAIGEAIDQGIAARNTPALLLWIVALLALGVVLSSSTYMLTRCGDQAWFTSARILQNTVIRHATGLGAALPQKIKTGEIVAVGASDLHSIAGVMEVAGRLTGSVVAFAVVAITLIGTSPTLGLVVLVGIPLATLGFMPLLKPLQKRTEAHREEVGTATAVAADIVSGLRILRGIGGERQFTARFAEVSQRVRQAGVAAGKMDSWIAGVALFLPGLVIALVTWLGARLALAGDISVGELVAFFGVSAFLNVPVGVVGEAVHRFNEARVAAARACAIVSLTPTLTSPADPRPLPAGSFGLREGEIDCAAGELTVITGADPELADRLGRYVDADVSAGGVALKDADLDEVRARILVAHNQDLLFSGRLADEIDMGRSVDLRTALWVADAMDVVDGLENGVDEHLAERGRTLSGGQRQRMVLARALSFDADVLVLDEPTSAVDAHTEARIVERVAELRRGRTTIVLSQSPLWKHVADKVYTP
ncbi:ABC transporter ATP-binding protein [Actinocrispum sp. NPDC049592]|uniref:ABC transporter ATP-binding protein n=1 Tax=Actinocrispum sp. NPDC049592 TaxID=3154835 RepID=UPI003422C742